MRGRAGAQRKAKASPSSRVPLEGYFSKGGIPGRTPLTLALSRWERVLEGLLPRPLGERVGVRSYLLPRPFGERVGVRGILLRLQEGKPLGHRRSREHIAAG